MTAGERLLPSGRQSQPPDEQQEALAAHVRRRLARLRWQHAAAAVLTPGRSGLLQRQVRSSLHLWWPP